MVVEILALQTFEWPWRLLLLLLLRLLFLRFLQMNRVIGVARVEFVREAWRAKLFRKDRLTSAGDVRDWKALFGCTPTICQRVWGALILQLLKPPKAVSVHLLWLLYFLKTYGTETVCSSFLNCDEKTFRTPLLQAISSLRVVHQRWTW
jgi:hypothetical protein